MAKLSVVVPFYNVGAYIEATLESIARQRFRDLEVIMVDDGSIDDSTLIAKAYAARDSRFRLVQQENMGLGPARNTGIRHATGKYLAFADSDDVLDPHAYHMMTTSLEETGSDIAAGFVKRFTPAGLTTSLLHVEPFHQTMLRTHVSRLPVLLQDRMIWNKVFRRSFWDAHGFEFPGMLYEDSPVTIRAYVLASSVDIFEDVVYFWRVRDDGALSITQRAREIQNIEQRMASVANVTGFLTANAPALKSAYDTTSLKSDLVTLVTAFEFATEAERALITELAADCLRTMEPAALASISAFRRLQFYLLQHGMSAELLDTMRYSRRGQIPITPNVRRDGRKPRWCARYPFFRDPARSIPDDVYDVTNEMTLMACLEKADWHEDRLRIEGYAYIRRLSSATPGECKIQVRLRNNRTHRVIRLPVENVWRPDVTARSGQGAVSYDWSGFVVEVNPRQLATLPGVWRAADWELTVRVTGNGLRREGPITLIRPGSALWPEGRWVTDSVWLQPASERDGRFVIRGQQVSAFVTGCTANGDVLEIEGWTSEPLSAGAMLEARPRKGGMDKVTVPAEPTAAAPGQPARHGFRARIEASMLASSSGVSSSIDRILHVHDEFTWDVHLNRGSGASTARLAIAPATAGARVSAGNREIIAIVTHFGSFSLLERTLRPLVTDLRWQDEGNLVLRGDHSGASPRPTEFILRHTTTRREHLLPLVWDESGFTATFNPARMPVLADRLPLSSGTWRLLARAGDTEVAVAVVRRLVTGLTGYHQVGLHEVEAQPYYSDSLRFHVRLARPDQEGGRFGLQWLQTVHYPAASAQPLRELAIFDSFSGRDYSCNPRAIYEELRRTRPDIDCVWLTTDGQFGVPDGARLVSVDSRGHFDALAQARYVVTNNMLPRWYRKRQGQICLQTWHGTPLKRIGLDIERPQFPNALIYPDVLRENAANWDVLLSPNGFSTPIFRSAFGFEGEILESGYPRNDPLHRPDREERAAAVRERLGLPTGKRIVLYAPTFRDDAFTGAGRFRFDLQLDVAAMTEALSDDHVLLMRMHTNVRQNPASHTANAFVTDVTLYPDITDLYLIADVLITDYSSVMFDFAATGRPILFYTYDLESYRDSMRGFYFGFEAEAPGPLISTTAGLIDALRDIRGVERSCRDAYAAFASKYCALDDGEAASRVVRRLLAGA